MNQHHRQHWSHSNSSDEAVSQSEFVLLWTAFFLLDAVLWLLFYRLGEWAWQWV